MKKIQLLNVSLTLMFSLATLAGRAQSLLTYGVEVGGGTSSVYSSLSYSASHQMGEYETILSQYDANDHYRTFVLGGYARYYFARAFYLQSGLYYTQNGGAEGFTKKTVLPSAGERSGWCPPGGCAEQWYDNRIRYRFHQAEVPFLLGVRFAQQLRLYGGASWGFLFKNNTEVNVYEAYQSQTDPIFTNLRVGIGADTQRLSLDVMLQGTINNNSSWEATVPLPEQFGSEQRIKTGGGGLATESIIIVIGYRLR